MVKRSRRRAVSRILLCQYEQAWRNRSSFHSGRTSGTVLSQNFVVELLIRLHHALNVEAGQGTLAAALPINFADLTNCCNHLVLVVHQEPRDPIFHQLHHTSASVGNHRRSSRHGLQRRETKRLLPLQRKQKGSRTSDLSQGEIVGQSWNVADLFAVD